MYRQGGNATSLLLHVQQLCPALVVISPLDFGALLPLGVIAMTVILLKQKRCHPAAS